MGFAVSSSGTDRTQRDGGQELTMLGKNCADEELKRGLGLSIKEIEPFLRAGGDAAEMKFMECCHYLWKIDGVELMEPLFSRFLTNYQRSHAASSSSEC